MFNPSGSKHLFTKCNRKFNISQHSKFSKLRTHNNSKKAPTWKRTKQWRNQTFRPRPSSATDETTRFASPPFSEHKVITKDKPSTTGEVPDSTKTRLISESSLGEQLEISLPSQNP